jgi:ribonuclease HI
MKPIWTPLERHLDHCQARLGRETVENLERKIPYMTAPWRQPTEVVIAEEIDLAKAAHDAMVQEPLGALIVYTDGSGINNKVGAAAVAPQLKIVRQAFMGDETVSTVYSAEIEGIHMALRIAMSHNYSQIIIFSDSQSALKATRNPGTPSGQYILVQIIQCLDQLQQSGKKASLHWIPAHQGIEGNERADIAAKEATGWRKVRSRNGRTKEVDTGITAARPLTLKQLQAAAVQVIRKLTQKEWEDVWDKEIRGRDLYRVSPRPTKSILKLHQGLSKPLSSILVQMRTGKIGLRHYLYSRNVPDIEDDRCRCGQSSQTVAHVLLSCRQYAQLREAVWWEEDKNGRKKRITKTNIREILNTPAYAGKAAKLLKATELLEQFRSQNTADQV